MAFRVTSGTANSVKCACSRQFSVSATVLRGKYDYFTLQKTATDPRYQEPDFFDKEAEKLDIHDSKYVDKLGELWVEKVGTFRDLGRKREDSLVAHDNNHWLPKVPPLQPKIEYEYIPELEDAPESVKKIFSVEFGERVDKTNFWKQQLVGAVRRHPLDKDSLEAKIGLYTALIRHWTALIDDVAKLSPYYPRRLKQYIALTVYKRRKSLRMLRDMDSEAFERVIETLGIAYHTPVLPEDLPENTRKQWVLHQVRLRCASEKDARLSQLHAEFKEKQSEFAEYKKKRTGELDEEQAKLETELRELKGTDWDEMAVGEYKQSRLEMLGPVLAHRHYYQNVW